MKPSRTSLHSSARRALAAALALTLPAAVATAAGKVTYDEHIVPILRNSCLNCHNPDKKKADFDASTYTGILAGGGSGKVLAPEDLSGSLLWKLINHLEEPRMPPKASKLTDAELAVFKQWIEGGLLENAGSKAAVARKPKADLALKASVTGKPDGPPPMPNGDLLLEPAVHAERAGAVTALAASPWAPLVAVAGQRQVILYNLETFQPEGILPFPEGYPYVLKFSTSGRLLLVGGGVGAKLGRVALYDVTTGRRVAEVGDEFDSVLAADVSPDQSRVALGGPSEQVRIYSTATGELVHTIKKHTDWVTAIAYSPDGVLLATGDRAGGAYLWESETAGAYSELKSSTPSKVTDIAWRDDANVVAITGEDAQVRLWEVENSTRIQKWAANGGGVEAMRFSHDGHILTTGRDRSARLYDASGKQVRAYDGLKDIGLVTAISHDNARVIAGDFSGEIRVWNAADGKLLGQLDSNPPTLAARIEADSRRLDEARTNHAKLTVARDSAHAAMTNAVASLESARRKVTETAAALKTADLDLEATRQTLAKATSTRDEAQKALQAHQSDLGVRTAAVEVARKLVEEGQAGVKSSDTALAEAEASHKAAIEALAKAAAAAEGAPGDSELADRAAQARSAVERAASALSALRGGSAEAGLRVNTGQLALKDAQAAAAKAQSDRDAAQKALAEASAALAAAEKKSKAATERQPKAAAQAEAAVKAVPAVEARVKKSEEALAKAQKAADESGTMVASLERDVARWKAGQVNARLIAVAEELSRRQTASEAAAAAALQSKASVERAAAELAALRKEAAESPALVQSRKDEVARLRSALEGARASLPALTNAVAARQSEWAALQAPLQSATNALAKGQALLKAAQEAATGAEASRKAAAEAAAQARALAEANPGVPAFAQTLSSAQPAVTNAVLVVEAARKAVAQVQSQVQDLTEAERRAAGASDAAAKALATAKSAVEKHPAAVQSAEAALAAAVELLAKATAVAESLPGRIARGEAAIAKATAAETEATATARKVAAELPPLQQRHEQLLAEYRKAKPAAAGGGARPL